MGYNCGSRKICTSTHYIRLDFLEKIVLGEIRRLTKLATQYEDEFAKIVMGHSIKTAEQERNLKQKELNTLIARDKELDNLCRACRLKTKKECPYWFKSNKDTRYGTGAVTEPVQKSHKIKGFEQSINSINLKNKYFKD